MHVAVIGRGMMGAAAARHLAKGGHQVTLIGPAEPVDKRSHKGVFASHYDEGRITRKNDAKPFWAEVAAASIARYAEIEAESGIRFFGNVGAMMAAELDSSWMKQVLATKDALGTDCEVLDHRALASRFDYFKFPSTFGAVYEPTGGGHVSPRNLVAAQTEAARRQGATIVDAVVDNVDETANGVTVRTAEGPIGADRALIAAGAMTDHVLARAPRLTVMKRTVAFFEIAADEAQRLADMPSLVFRSHRPGGPYLLPPIRYPDGRTYIKLGGDPTDEPIETEAEIGDWFRSGGDANVRDFLEDSYRELMPTVRIETVSMDACVTSWTEDRYPEIGMLTDRIGVATGGNGAGAKCSDELGRRGALAVTSDI
ncbi:MAG: FAD-dependent oxidoreductase [Pseudomonadota bacterium]